MKIKNAPLLTMAVLLAYAASPLAFAQLPPTNMGKFVHQPGDNQYSVQTQGERHGGGYFDTNGSPHVMVKPAGGGGGGGAAPSGGSFRSVAPPPPKGPDVSVEPITADEPIAPAGFPPMPIAFDLPVGPGFGATPSASWREGGAPRAGSSGPAVSGMHQHYAHYQPGAFQPGSPPAAQGQVVDVAPAVPGGSGGSGSGSGGGAGGGGSSNYYKCRTPPAINRVTEHYNVNNGGSGGGGSAPPSGPSAKDLKALGKAPSLDTAQDTGAPEAPSPVLVNQSTTQDLSLPDDEFTSRYFKNGKSGRYAKRMVRKTRTFGRQMLRSTGVPISF